MTTTLPVLSADCSACFALCCSALGFRRSADFPIDKAPGTPCQHVNTDHRCRIHDRLAAEGFRGCIAYDCFGAGQRISQVAFGGRDWRTHPEVREGMFAALPVLSALHELLWYLDEASERLGPGPLRDDVLAATRETADLAGTDATQLHRIDHAAQWQRVGPLLDAVSASLRAGAQVTDRRVHRRADLAGADLSGRDLRGADLREVVLIAANLTGVDLRGADLLGADLRDCRLNGADLRDALFLTRRQLDSAVTDGSTRLPSRLRPAGAEPGGQAASLRTSGSGESVPRT